MGELQFLSAKLDFPHRDVCQELTTRLPPHNRTLFTVISPRNWPCSTNPILEGHESAGFGNGARIPTVLMVPLCWFRFINEVVCFAMDVACCEKLCLELWPFETWCFDVGELLFLWLNKKLTRMHLIFYSQGLLSCPMRSPEIILDSWPGTSNLIQWFLLFARLPNDHIEFGAVSNAFAHSALFLDAVHLVPTNFFSFSWEPKSGMIFWYFYL